MQFSLGRKKLVHGNRETNKRRGERATKFIVRGESIREKNKKNVVEGRKLVRESYEYLDKAIGPRLIYAYDHAELLIIVTRNMHIA